jgi:phosphogluconate dehydratase
MNLNNTVHKVTERIKNRSRTTRSAYLNNMQQDKEDYPVRQRLSCGNIAHAVAACGASDKKALVEQSQGNLGIITAFNDMLSAHQPFETYPNLIKEAVRDINGTAQVAGGVPAMCDGVTQGQPGMELSLFSRDIIAMSAAVGLSHNCFDAAVFLGVCDKIVPGLFMAAATFGHLPCVFLPAGPMSSGIPNDQKSKVRQQFALGKVGRDELLQAEMNSYHSAGTCTFYGTANTNQFLMEIMGLHMPGAAFVNPNSPLREALTKVGAMRALQISALGDEYIPAGEIMDERAFVNAIVGLHATGGSTNLVLHLCAMARAAGVIIDLEDFSDLSEATPLLARVYPNGTADVNHFHAAGGAGYIIGELLDNGLLHDDVKTVFGDSLHHYSKEPFLDEKGEIYWKEGTQTPLDTNIVRPVADPFQKNGGLARLNGNLGTAVMKVSAVAPERHIIEAPVKTFHDQDSVKQAYKDGKLNQDVIIVVRFQGPKANGMPELHGLTPTLSNLQDQGFKVALITDGRMSGASGKVPAAIHLAPEACDGGPIAKLREGDIVRLDATNGSLQVLIDETEWAMRENITQDLSDNQIGLGRNLFNVFRDQVGPTDTGACVVLKD